MINSINIKIYIKGAIVNIKWQTIQSFQDIKYEKGLQEAESINKITINRPEVRNAFRPETVFELKKAFSLA